MTNAGLGVEEVEDLLLADGAVAAPIVAYREEDDAVTRQFEALLHEQRWIVQVTTLDRRMMCTEELLGHMASGLLVRGDTLVWHGGMEDWLPIAEVEELPAVFPSSLGAVILEKRPAVTPRGQATSTGGQAAASFREQAAASLVGHAAVPLGGHAAVSLGGHTAERRYAVTQPPRGMRSTAMAHSPLSRQRPPSAPLGLVVLASSAVAALAISLTTYALSAGGVFESGSSETAQQAAADEAPAAIAVQRHALQRRHPESSGAQAELESPSEKTESEH